MPVNLEIVNFPAQDLILNDPTRFKIAPKGRRFGITKGVANHWIRKGIENAQGHKKDTRLWVDTIYGNIDRYVERYFMPHLKLLPPTHWHRDKKNNILYLYNDIIDFKSADHPESLEGFGYNDVFLNEAGIILKNAALWQNTIRPMLMDYQSPALIAGTPKSKNEFYKLACKAQDPAETQYKYYHFTSYDNPYIAKAEIDDMVKDLPEQVIRQEVFAEFVDDIGTVFRFVKEAATEVTRPYEANRSYYIGVDVAKTFDFTVIKVLRDDGVEVYSDRFNSVEWAIVKQRIKVAYDTYKGQVVIDSTGAGDPIFEDLVGMGIEVEGFVFTNASKLNLIRTLVLCFEDREIKIIRDTVTENELTNYEYEITPSGNVKYGTQNFHDDTVIALALAKYCLDKYAGRKFIFVQV